MIKALVKVEFAVNKKNCITIFLNCCLENFPVSPRLQLKPPFLPNCLMVLSNEDAVAGQIHKSVSSL
jgi:hypothetical protein